MTQKSYNLLVILLWVLTGLTLGNWLGQVPNQITLHLLTLVSFWSWAILWPLSLAKEVVTLIYTEAPKGAVAGILLVFGVAILARWNWPRGGIG